MAIKSKNTKGNPWHEEGTGEFTSSNGQGSEKSTLDEKSEVLKNDFNLGDIKKREGHGYGHLVHLRNRLNGKNKSMESSVEAGFKKFENAKEAEQMINSMIGKNVVHFEEQSSTVEINEMARAIYDVYQDFPKIIENNLISYTNKFLSNEELQQVADGIMDKKKELYEMAMKRYGGELPDSVKKNFLGEDSVRNRVQKASEHSQSTYKYTENTGGSMMHIGDRFLYDYESEQTFTPSVIINKQYFNNRRDSMERSWRKWGYESGHNMGSEDVLEVYATCTHELGHAVHLTLQHYLKDENFYINEFYKKRDNEPLSKYANTSTAEFMAECFADYYTNRDGAKDISKRAIKAMKEKYRELFGGGNEL